MPGFRVSLRRLVALPLAYAAVFGVCEAAGVNRDEGFVAEVIGATALGLILLLAAEPRDLIAAYAAVASGVAFSYFTHDPCTPTIFIAPVVGYAVYRLVLRWMPRPEAG